MLRKSLLVVLLMALVLSVAATVAEARPPYEDPYWAPQWFKDCTGFKQWAEWTFCTPPDGGKLSPSGWDRNYPDPQTQPYITLTGQMGWHWDVDTQNGYLGYLNQSGASQPVDFHIDMDNVYRPDLYKQVWLAFELKGNASVLPGEIEWGYPDGTVKKVSDISYIREPNSDWVTWYFEIRPQPDWEEIMWKWNVPVDGCVYVDNVRMVTQCIPEPVFFQMGALLGLSGIGLLRARKR